MSVIRFLLPSGYPYPSGTGIQISQLGIRGFSNFKSAHSLAFNAFFPFRSMLRNENPQSSVAKGPKVRAQNTKRAEKNCVGPGKSGAELLTDLSNKGRKGAKLYCSLVLHQNSHILGRKLLLSTQLFSYYFAS
jgi:hypothetical protein